MATAAAPALSVPLKWICVSCIPEVILQGLYTTYPVLVSSMLIRCIVSLVPARHSYYDAIATVLGLWTLWWYYGYSTGYFLILLILVYLLVTVGSVGKRGILVGGVCMVFIIMCELLIVSSAEWHKVRGSFLVMSMKLVSLAYDIDTNINTAGRDHRGGGGGVPSVISYVSYAVFPATTVFGPFVTFNDHLQYTNGTPLSLGWIFCAVRSLSMSLLTLSLSMCLFPFLFEEPFWNKWFAAYSAAASFRYSHYFISFLSEATAILSGIGYKIEPAGTITWSKFRVTYPLDVEVPRSLGSLVNSWNIPMHVFLKNYVFKPVLIRLNYGGAFFFTFLTSAMLHGLNFQLAAVLLSIALYAYTENKFRYKLSKLLDACVKDRPCSHNCSHKHKSYLSVSSLECSVGLCH
ncbi:PREDICTED: protein-serine O-palmitoleoyltransferase porcupine-like isoform X2 [Amphimedon queenslandica]|uniref:Protein-serine O-palmitoleoyltransferase porcupine n=1 Tax=Amphimedon queenslandica TaxID=400682 RepID=A0AAN0J8A9_AMPQE|nr:PREDICTED: protein-serine O-palmitoleoyltransferase porcupine-like isoform X2 [Amphimedon queenslandica]|eukprot:XP_019852943.1 PREDICTED: protein-serine O-palmitoleoyltransferase porcupine-like isoform X2 [Amphimedon queenslandica]